MEKCVNGIFFFVVYKNKQYFLKYLSIYSRKLLESSIRHFPDQPVFLVTRRHDRLTYLAVGVSRIDQNAQDEKERTYALPSFFTVRKESKACCVALCQHSSPFSFNNST